MAVLKKEEFLERLHARLGEDSSDEAIAFLEDMTDTYNDMETRANGDGVDWKQKYDELNETWRKRYRHRFFSGGSNNPDEKEESESRYNPEEVKVEDLFKDKEEK